MNIAILGTPGTGKTALAEALKKELGERTYIVDGVAERVSKTHDRTIGVLGDYLININIALQRECEERLARRSESYRYVISCGTLIETAIYVAMQFAHLTATISDEERETLMPRMDATLRMLALLYNETFSYDVAFYLPTVSDDADARYMDQQLQGALGGFRLMPVTMIEPGADAMATVLKEIGEVQAR